MTMVLVTTVKASRPIFIHDGMSTSDQSAIWPSVNAAWLQPCYCKSEAGRSLISDKTSKFLHLHGGKRKMGVKKRSQRTRTIIQENLTSQP